jgi:hypothetical protein
LPSTTVLVVSWGVVPPVELAIFGAGYFLAGAAGCLVSAVWATSVPTARADNSRSFAIEREVFMDTLGIGRWGWIDRTEAAARVRQIVRSRPDAQSPEAGRRANFPAPFDFAPLLSDLADIGPISGTNATSLALLPNILNTNI